MTSMNLQVDPHVERQYKIVRYIGGGAYGVVWKAIDRRTKKLVALKKVFDAFTNSTDAQRTYREAMLLLSLHHVNIVKLLNIIRSLDDIDVYMVFELQESDVHAVIKAGNVLQHSQRQYIAYQLIRSTYYLHARGVIHRDLKPANILINSDCSIKLADFGLARCFSLANNSINLNLQQQQQKGFGITTGLAPFKNRGDVQTNQQHQNGLAGSGGDGDRNNSSDHNSPLDFDSATNVYDAARANSDNNHINKGVLSSSSSATQPFESASSNPAAVGGGATIKAGGSAKNGSNNTNNAEEQIYHNNNNNNMTILNSRIIRGDVGGGDDDDGGDRPPHHDLRRSPSPVVERVTSSSSQFVNDNNRLPSLQHPQQQQQQEDLLYNPAFDLYQHSRVDGAGGVGGYAYNTNNNNKEPSPSQQQQQQFINNASITFDSMPPLTDYIATRWYRAPELLCGTNSYTTAIDMWAIGCIIAELFLGTPLFKGSSTEDQLQLVICALGFPTAEEVRSWRVETAEKTIANLSRTPLAESGPYTSLHNQLHNTSSSSSPSSSAIPRDAIDLIKQLLSLDPNKRLTSLQALQHPYISVFATPEELFGDPPAECFSASAGFVNNNKIGLGGGGGGGGGVDDPALGFYGSYEAQQQAMAMAADLATPVYVELDDGIKHTVHEYRTALYEQAATLKTGGE